MARYRSRRSNRRSASQSAASLLALALPAPIQRVADTRLGPLLMLVGVPTMIVAGLLNVNWSNGLPSVTVNPQAAANVLQKTRDGYNNFEQQGGLQDFGQAASGWLNGNSNTAQGYNSNVGYGQIHQTTQQTTPARPHANFPSTQPQSTTTQRDYRYTAQPTAPLSQQQTYGQQQAQPQTYAQQPTYAPLGYAQQAASPSDSRGLTSLQQQQLQQQLYQQQLYQQQQNQLQQQQLSEQQQYQLWLAQQRASGARQPASNGYQQYDANGRPVATGYEQPTSTYAQPTTQYGQQNYNQGNVPNTNTHGRY